MKKTKLGEKWKFPFGKYRGRTFYWVGCHDFRYIEWCLDNIPNFKESYNENKEWCDLLMEKGLRNYIKYLPIKLPKNKHFYKRKGTK